MSVLTRITDKHKGEPFKAVLELIELAEKDLAALKKSAQMGPVELADTQADDLLAVVREIQKNTEFAMYGDMKDVTPETPPTKKQEDRLDALEKKLDLVLQRLSFVTFEVQ